MVMTSSNIVLWVYIVLLVAGGLVGFLKAGSKVSILMSVAFAVPLSLCAARILQIKYLPEILMGVLLLVFVIRLAKTGKFMPSGLMLALTGLALLLRFWLKP